MQAWLYDEDRWPSGSAGGQVTKNPAYRKRSLQQTTLRKGEAIVWDQWTVAAFLARVDGRFATNVRQLAESAQPEAVAYDECVLVFRIELEPLSDWYNRYTYLDTLNHEAVGEFIRVTHEAYAQHCGDDFEKVVPGIFTDEPYIGPKLSGDVYTGVSTGLPWTDALPRVFLQRYGYDLIPHLPALFFDVDGQAITPARHDYHDCATHLFVDAFARQIGAWCDAHDLLFTGHVLEEETLSSQTSTIGSCLRFYEYMQAPGMDLLTEHWRAYNTAKQVSSSARQFGRKWRLTETYGCTGWDFPFLGHKALGDWQAALGINLRVQHLAWYTMEGKRSATIRPPSFTNPPGGSYTRRWRTISPASSPS